MASNRCWFWSAANLGYRLAAPRGHCVLARRVPGARLLSAPSPGVPRAWPTAARAASAGVAVSWASRIRSSRPTDGGGIPACSIASSTRARSSRATSSRLDGRVLSPSRIVADAGPSPPRPRSQAPPAATAATGCPGTTPGQHAPRCGSPAPDRRRGPVGCQKSVGCHAARSYSWMRPPRTSRRWRCRAAADESACSQHSEGSGVDKSRPRWGRRRL
jgi:hypothetical protein